MTVIELWIGSYSNAGVKIKTDWLKRDLLWFQEKYPEKNYQLVRSSGKWFIAEGDQ